MTRFIQHFCGQWSVPKPRVRLLAVFRQGAGASSSVALLHERKYLDRAACLRTMSAESRWNHARIVYNDDVVSSQMLGN